jgi:quinohemoprotein ethanol dehydrogenase
MRSTVIRSVIFLAAWLAAVIAVGAERTPSPSVPNASDWPLVGLTPENHHFSPLRQINDSNVQRLGIAWATDMPAAAGLAGVPIVVDGVVYQSGQLSIVSAVDIRTGRLLWVFDPKVTFTGEIIPSLGARMNRGVAVWGDKVYVGTGDCRLVAVNRMSGELAWQADVCMGDSHLAITAAPSVGGGKVFIGPSNMDNGTRRGFVDAYDAASGERLWRFYTIPGDPAQGFESKAMEMASKTWGADYWKHTGGASVYGPMTYDPKLNLLYFGVGSAIPDAPIDRGKNRGDELFSASLVAVEADTGKYVWHYSQTPDNAWNYDNSAPITIAELRIGGKNRRVVMNAPKNGYFYVNDARTGELLAADQYGVRVNWSSHVDMNTGRPVRIPDADFWVTGSAMQYPFVGGAHNWMPMAYSPLTGLVYITAMDVGNRTTYTPTRRSDSEGLLNLSAGQTRLELLSSDDDDGRALLVAWDPVARKARWKIDEPLPAGGGSLATAGNLVFYSRGDGEFRAFAADSGKVLWSTALPGTTRSTAVTVDVDGEQVLLLAIGSDGSSGIGLNGGNMATTERTRQAPARLVAFKLGGTLALPEIDMSRAFPEPPLPRPAPEAAARGRETLMNYGCDYCHGGEDLELPAGSVPDLRKSNSNIHATLDKIVIGGALKSRGMPQFADMPDGDLKLIQAYMLDRAWTAHETQKQAGGVEVRH